MKALTLLMLCLTMASTAYARDANVCAAGTCGMVKKKIAGKSCQQFGEGDKVQCCCNLETGKPHQAPNGYDQQAESSGEDVAEQGKPAQAESAEQAEPADQAD